MHKQQNSDQNHHFKFFDWLSESAIGLIELDLQLCCKRINSSAESLIWHKNDPDNKNSELPAEFKQGIEPLFRALMMQQSSSLTSHLLLNSNKDQQLLLKLELFPVKDHFGEISSVIMTLVNSSHNAKQARELKVFRNAVENTGSAVVITNIRGEIEYANNRFSEITGYEFDEIEGKKPGFLRSDDTPASTYKELWQTILNHQKWRGTLLNKRKNGTTYWALQNISPIHDELGNIINFVSVSEDISQMKEHDAQMEKLAYFDPLTDLGNRRSFRRTLEQYLHNPQSQGVNALLLLDLDHFKQINDTMGHDAGDALLTAVASRLNFCVSQKSSVFRLGGDEFTIIFRNCTDRNQIVERTQQILNLLSQPIQIGPHEIRVTVSIGITLIGIDSPDASDLLRNADLAMYYAKRHGRNTYAFYEEQMDQEAQHNLSIEHDLRNALDSGQLHVVYQPQIDCVTGKVTALEALLRWQHPLDGNIPPPDFIPHAEETGLIVPIGRWVMEQACAHAKHIQEQGLPPVKVCVNLSARQFDDPQLLQHIESALEKSALEPRWLELEITESMLMRDIESAIQVLHRIKVRGISLAIDDFGTGYSSLNYLKKMPVDLLKIDRSFVQDIPQDRDNMAITSTIIAMSKQLGLRVVAEGVENHDQLQFLHSNQCNLLQGFLISKPVKFEDFMAEYHSCQSFCTLCNKVEHCQMPKRTEQVKPVALLN